MKENNEIVFGRKPILDIVENGNIEVNKIWISQNIQDRELKNLLFDYAKGNKIPYSLVPKKKLDGLSSGGNHQGVALSISPISYLPLKDLLEIKSDLDVVLVCHEIQDTHNLGAMIRTFVAAGGNKIILTGKSSVGVNGTVVKTSAGTLFQASFSRVTNCNQVIKTLQENEYWVYGSECGEDSVPLYKTKFSGNTAIIMGNEGDGLPSLVKKNCDHLVNIPISDLVDSLNVSVAFGVILFECLRQKIIEG